LSKKGAWLHFGRLFHKLILSPCSFPWKVEKNIAKKKDMQTTFHAGANFLAIVFLKKGSINFNPLELNLLDPVLRSITTSERVIKFMVQKTAYLGCVLF
jgi:hypothetical protein